MSHYSKEDVQLRYSRNHGGQPCVNVKVYDSLEDGFRKLSKVMKLNPHFTPEWIEQHVSDERIQAYWEMECECGWEALEYDATEILGPYAKVHQDGRSSGWCVVRDLPLLQDWDAVQLAKWRSFEKFAKREADNVMSAVVERIYDEDFQDWVRA